MVLQLSAVGHESELAAKMQQACGSGSWLEQGQVGDGKIVVAVVGIDETVVEELVVERMKLGLLAWRSVEVVQEQRTEFGLVVQKMWLLLGQVRIGLLKMQHLVCVLVDGKSHRHSQQRTGLVAVGTVLVVAWVEL
jgi:hypothetical protein